MLDIDQFFLQASGFDDVYHSEALSDFLKGIVQQLSGGYKLCPAPATIETVSIRGTILTLGLATPLSVIAASSAIAIRSYLRTENTKFQS